MRVKHHNKIKNGKMSLNDRSRLNEDIRGRKDGDYYFVIKEVEPTIADDLRRYYFSQVLTLISEETGILSKDDLHLNMKIKFASYLHEKTGMTVTHSVFSDSSTMGVAVKRKFIGQVKQFAFEFLNITFPEKGEAEDD